MNTRSLSKLDELLVEFNDHSMDVMSCAKHGMILILYLSVTYGPTVTGSLHVLGLVLCRHEASLRVNHGGAAIISAAGIQLVNVDISPQPSTFECVAARVTSASSSCIAAVYCPGSSPVSAAFFTELADILDRLTTFVDPVVLAVMSTFDLNVQPTLIMLSSVISLRAMELYNESADVRTTLEEHLSSVPTTVCHLLLSTSSTLVCLTTVCCVRRQSTPQPHKGRGDRLMTIIPR